MADGPNKSNKPINGGPAGHWTEATFKARSLDIESMFDRSDIRKYIQRAEKLEAELARMNPADVGYRAKVENTNFAFGSVEEQEYLVAQHINKSYADMVTTASKYGNVNSRTTTMSGSHSYYRQARNSPDMYRATEEIEHSINSRMAAVSQRGSVLAGRMRGLGQEDMPQSLQQEASWIQQEESQIAYEKRLLKSQNKAGLSTEKLFGGADNALNKTSNYFGNKDIQNQVSSGNVGSMADETKSLGFKMQGVHIAQQQYDSASSGGAGASEMAKFAKALKDATESLVKQQKVVDEMGRQGVGGGGMGWGDVGKVASLAGRAISHTAKSSRQIMVDNDLTEMSLKTKFASMGNRIYQKSDAAIMGGDMDALLELTGGSMNFAANHANFNKDFSNATHGVQQIGDAAVGTGNTITAAKGGVMAGGPVGAGIAGVSQGVIEAGTAAVKLDNLRRGNLGGADAAKTWDVSMGLSQQMRAMDATMMRSVHSQGMTTYNSVSGLGDAGGLASALMDTSVLGGLAGVGISGKQGALLASSMKGAGAMSSADALRTMTGAGAAKQRGILGQQEYASMSAALMGAGGGAGDMESVMAAAVAAGMDNSKSIGELVAGTLSLSQGLTGMGVGGVSSTQGMLTGASQALIAAGVNPNLAAGAAASSISSYNDSQSDNSFTLGNIMERSALRKQFGGKASIFQLNRLSEMTTSDHKVLMDAARNPDNADMQREANQLAKGKGLGELLNPGGAGFDLDMIKNMAGASFTGSAVDKGALGTGININAIRAKANNGGKLTGEEMAFMAEYKGARGEAIISAIGGRDGAKADVNKVPKIAGSSAEETQAIFKNKEMRDAEAKFGGKASDIFKSLEVTMKGIQENVGPEKVGKMVESAAEKFEVPALAFERGSEKFDKAVTRFIDWQNKRMGNISETGTKTKAEKAALEEQKNDYTRRKAGAGAGGTALDI